MIGRQSVFGTSAPLDSGISLSDATLQFAGDASIIGPADGGGAEHSIGFRTMIIRHEQIILVQANRPGAASRSIPRTPACQDGCRGCAAFPVAAYCRWRRSS